MSVGDCVTHGSGHAALVEHIDVGEPAAGSRDDILGLRNRPSNARAVYLDDEHLLFDTERKTATVPHLAKPAGV